MRRLSAFTPAEQAVDMDGSLTIAHIETELANMAGTRRVRCTIGPATWQDGTITVAHLDRDVWNGHEWVDQ